MVINFPNKKRPKEKVITKGNLGMDFEAAINESNEYYLANDIAIIHKKPTPVQIVKVDYPMRSKAVITEAYYKTPSTTDYNGIYKGRYIDFEAKETNSKTAFPLKNIHPHQMEHLENIIRHGGIGFMIFYWKVFDEYYILKYDVIKEYWDNSFGDGRQSIPYSTFKEKGYPVEPGYLPRIKYLKVIDKLFFEE